VDASIAVAPRATGLETAAAAALRRDETRRTRRRGHRVRQPFPRPRSPITAREDARLLRPAITARADTRLPRPAITAHEDTRLPRPALGARTGEPPAEQTTAGDAAAAAAVEALILERCAGQIAMAAGRAATVVVPGAGAARATLRLLESLEEPAACRPVDRSRGRLGARARALSARFPRLRVEPLAGDLADAALWSRMARTLARPDLVYLPGTLIDALEPSAVRALLRQVAAACPAALLVLGAATARCNLPCLAALGRLSGWRHCQYWSDGRVRHAIHVLEAAG